MEIKNIENSTFLTTEVKIENLNENLNRPMKRKIEKRLYKDFNLANPYVFCLKLYIMYNIK